MRSQAGSISLEPNSALDIVEPDVGKAVGGSTFNGIPMCRCSSERLRKQGHMEDRASSKIRSMTPSAEQVHLQSAEASLPPFLLGGSGRLSSLLAVTQHIGGRTVTSP